MITVYLGDVSDYLASMVRLDHLDARLLTEKNYNELTPGTYYTSIADIGNLCNLGAVLRKSDLIIYAPPPDGQWSDTHRGVSKMKLWTEDYLKIFSFRTQVKNFSIIEPNNSTKILALADLRKTDTAQLWIAGCSSSHGVGVKEEQRYGQLLAEKLNLSVSFLTNNASSVAWAADQILRSDIRKNDIIIWGVTSTPRVSWFNNGSLTHVTPRRYELDPELTQRFSLDYLDSEDVIYRSVIALFQVSNYCKKIGANLLLVSLLDDGTLFSYAKDFTNLLMLNQLWGRTPDNIFPDFGFDKIHPGIKTHKFYANEIFQKIKENKFIANDQ